MHPTKTALDCSPVSQWVYTLGTLAEDPKIQVKQSHQFSCPIGQMITLAIRKHLTKVHGFDKFLPCLAQMLDSWWKEDPATLTLKMLTIKANVPEHLCHFGHSSHVSLLDTAVGNLIVIMFYYLLQLGEYTSKSKCHNSKQIIAFKLENITFLDPEWPTPLDALGCTSWPNPVSRVRYNEIGKLKNGWKGVCIHQGKIARGLLALSTPWEGNTATCGKTPLIPRFTVPLILSREYGLRSLINALVWHSNLHPYSWLPISRFPYQIHKYALLHSGGANYLALAGYSDQQIQKMDR